MKAAVGVGYYLRTLSARVVNIVCGRQRRQKKQRPSHSGLKKKTKSHREPLRATEKATASHFSKTSDPLSSFRHWPKSSHCTRRKHSDRTTRTSGEEPMEVEPDVWRRMRGKTRTVSTDQPTAPSSNITTDTARLETEGDHDDKRRRSDEPETQLSPVAQNEAPVLDPCRRSQQEWAVISFKVGSRNSLAWRTTSTATQGGKHEPVDTCRRT